MLNIAKRLAAGFLWKIIKGTFCFGMAVFVFLFGSMLFLFFTYGVLANLRQGLPVVDTALSLMDLQPQAVLSRLGEQIFTNIPFADFLNAVFITHVEPDLLGLISDIVTAALAGLLFYLIARINTLLSSFIRNRLLFSAIVAVMTIASICLAMIVTTWMNLRFDGAVLMALQCGVIVLSVLLHALFLFIGLRSIRFFKVLLHTMLDVLEGACNNIFLWFCSFLALDCLPRMDVPQEVQLVVLCYGGFFLFVLYSFIMGSIISSLWRKFAS